ncbi:hypothetical protein [Streptomyces litchfieldiae]|uniref:Uncharacterized protein n=1 Tax=Streptomyces litchfieldiae TaxID=3075543 RepID=A0ABU2MK81_9ACTN|nr:hypothetical protein [Streptomyces sp. DSM 44938]MDT0341519.1 hypothetical protein [Streptomyces sp. DSM 44938]
MTYPNRDEHAAQRRELRDLLANLVSGAVDRDGVEMYLSTGAVLGVPIPGSLLVTAEPEDVEHPVRLPVDMLVDGLRDKYGKRAEVFSVELPSGPAVRCRRQEHTDDARALGQPADRPSTLLEYYVPVPNSAAWLLLTFSTPIPELADVQVEMFDAIATTLRWSYPE